MKRAIKITLITIAIVIAVMILAIVILFAVASKQPMVKEGYYNDVKTSAPTLQISVDLLKAPFDVSGINIPCFMVAGTKKVDAGDGKNSGICPLVELQEKYDNISADVSKIIARRVDTDHGDMLPYADGYMTAWFMYHLQGDEEAGRIFFGDNAEILTNANWQDVEKNI